MKLRVGEAGSRFTPGFDAVRHQHLTAEDYLEQLRAQLADGWGGLAGTVDQMPAAEPDGAPEEYIMQPFTVKLGHEGNHWLPVMFELGHDEIGSTAVTELWMAGDLVDLFSEHRLSPLLERSQ